MNKHSLPLDVRGIGDTVLIRETLVEVEWEDTDELINKLYGRVQS